MIIGTVLFFDIQALAKCEGEDNLITTNNSNLIMEKLSKQKGSACATETVYYSLITVVKIVVHASIGIPAIYRLYSIYEGGPRYLIAFKKDPLFVSDSVRNPA